MWSDAQESGPSASWLDLPENGWGRSSAGPPACGELRGYSPRSSAPALDNHRLDRARAVGELG